MSQGTDLAKPLVVPNSGRWIGNDGSWSTFLVQVGTPPQLFHVLPNISGQTIYVPIAEDCEPERMNITDCGAKRGVDVFESSPSPGFQRNKSSTWEEVGSYRMGLGANLGLTGDAYYGYDNVSLGLGSFQNASRVEDLAIAAYATPDLWVGQLGLSINAIFMKENDQSPSYLKKLKDEGKIPSLSFGYQAGSPNRLTEVTGSLILGGYDRSRQSNLTLLVPLNPDVVVGVQSINIELTNGTTTNLLGNGIKATIDSNTADMWLPTSTCDEFAAALGLTYFQEADRYVLTDSARSAIQVLSPTFSFVIGTSVGGGATVKIEIPYGAFDLQATYPIFGTPTYYFPLRRAANQSQLTLGRAFLQEVYLSVDWERSVFNISQAQFRSPTPPADLVAIEPIADLLPGPDQSTGISKSLSAGAIAGIAVGSASLLVILAAVWWRLYSRSQKARKNATTGTERPFNLPTDEKEVTVHRRNTDTRTDLELEGNPVTEMYSPYGHGGMRKEYRYSGQLIEPVEADSISPVFELVTVGNRPLTTNK